MGGGQTAPRSAAADQQNIKKLESELSEIKHMLTDYGHRNQNQVRGSDILNDFDIQDENSLYSVNNTYNNTSADFVKSQKLQIKEMQEKLEQAKSQYKIDKAALEDLRLQDPALYRKKSEVLAQVKEGLDRKISQINQRVAKVKEMEAKY